MANDFSSDGNCVALYRFESGALLTDSQGSNDLINGGTALSADVSDYQEGAASGDFSGCECQVTDTLLSADFPLKNGGSYTSFSFCFWFKHQATEGGIHERLFEKGSEVYAYIETGGSEPRYGNVYINGSIGLGYNFNDGIWYHMAVTYDSADDSYRVRVWDDNAGAQLFSDVTGTTSWPLSGNSGAFYVGAGSSATWKAWNGNLDEVVVFNGVLSVSEIDEVRAGTYPPTVSRVFFADHLAASKLSQPALSTNTPFFADHLAISNLPTTNLNAPLYLFADHLAASKTYAGEMIQPIRVDNQAVAVFNNPALHTNTVLFADHVAVSQLPTDLASTVWSVGVQKFINQLGDQGESIVTADLGVQEVQRVLLTLGMHAQSLQRVLATIIEDTAQSIQRVLATIEDVNVVQSIQRVTSTILATEVVYREVQYDIYLDGVSVKNYLTGAVVEYDEDSIHNKVTLEVYPLKSEYPPRHNMWEKADPDINSGQSRIEVHVGTRVLYFLLEKRQGSERGFNISGRSLTAQDDYPYVETETVTLDEPETASSLCGTLAVNRAIDWQADDWVLPQDIFEADGYPARVIDRVAEQVGAVVRSDDAGDFVVRAALPVRPIDMQGTAPEISYDREITLLELGVQELRGTGYNKVTVDGYSPDVDLPKIETETDPDGNRVEGDDTFVRVYWYDAIPSSAPSKYTTDGYSQYLGQHTDTVTEVVEFRDGIANLSYPLTSLTYCSWIGDTATLNAVEKYQGELTLSLGDDAAMSERYRVAEVKYTTTYWRYKLHGHNVERLLLVLDLGGGEDVTVDVVVGEGDNEAGSVGAQWLTNESVAVVRGKYELDKDRYDRKVMTLRVPYNDAALDGVVVSVDNGELSVNGRCHVTRSRIIFDGPMVLNELEVVRYLV